MGQSIAIAIQTSTDQCFNHHGVNALNLKSQFKSWVTKDMSGKPRLNAHPESTVNGGVATMSWHLKKRQERRPSCIKRQCPVGTHTVVQMTPEAALSRRDLS